MKRNAPMYEAAKMNYTSDAHCSLRLRTAEYYKGLHFGDGSEYPNEQDMDQRYQSALKNRANSKHVQAKTLQEYLTACVHISQLTGV